MKCKSAIRMVVLLLLGSALLGCSATSTFCPYPHQIEPLKQSLVSGMPPDFKELLDSERCGGDKLLYNLEHGRLAQLFGQLETSQQDFSVAIETLKANDQKATISASELGANLAAMMVNENAVPYKGEGFERVLLHHYQAMNYLLRSDLEGAGVEFRWANAEQDEALRRHASELESTRREASNEGVAGAAENSAVRQQYAQLDEIAGRVKNSFQNAYSFYLSGLIYELQGEANDAFIDYKKALEIYPENPFLQKDVLRLARQLNMSDEFSELKTRFPATAQALSTSKPGKTSGELIVIFEEGFVPRREELKLPVALPNGLVTLALPFYQVERRETRPLTLMQNQQVLGATFPICEVRTLAVKSLLEKTPMLVTCQVIRATAKFAAQKYARDQFGAFGQFAANLYNLVSENADLRTWLTLPADVQILRTSLPAGLQPLELSFNGWPGPTVEVTIKERGKTILYVVKTGDQYYHASVVY